MTIRILIDLSHNESYTKIPEGLFDLEYLFTYVKKADSFPIFRELSKYQILLIGDVIPSNPRKDHLFAQEEIRDIKKYIRNGGKLLFTTSSGGDFEYTREIGSIRAFSSVTGVDRFWWGELFSKEKEKFINQPENLIFSNFPNHEIFNGISKLVLADLTFMDVKEFDEDLEEANTILNSHKDSWFRYFDDDYEEEIGSTPVIVSKESGDGKSIVIGSTLFMTNDPQYGINFEDNGKFFKNIIEWLLD